MSRFRDRVGDVTGARSARRAALGVLICLGALMLPASAWAGVPPAVTTQEGPQPLSATQELVSGTVNPHGQSTDYWVAYAPSTAAWCTGGGGSSGTHSITTSTTLSYTDSNPHNVSVVVAGLTSGTTYCAEVVARSSFGTTYGPDPNTLAPIAFTAGQPLVTSTEADTEGVQLATVQGTVDPAGQSTTYYAAYDLATSNWCTSGGAGTPTYTTAPATLSAQDTLAHNVTVEIAQSQSTPLLPNTDYCAAIVASNGSSTPAGTPVYGTADSLQYFTTDPAVVTGTVISTGARTAQLSGQVNPDGVSTTYYAAYAPVGSNWCQNGSGSPASQTSPQTLGAQDQSAHAVTVTLSGLTTGTTYCVSLRSENTPLGVSDGGQAADPFTAGLPTATSTDINPDAPTTAELDGTVSPAGQTTTYDVVYDLQNSNWCHSGGGTGSPTYASTPVTLPETDTGTYDVTAHVTGLTPGTAYCAALAAVNGSNGQSGSPPQSIGATMNFTAGIAPDAGDAQAQDLTASTTLVSGTAGAEGQSTTYEIGYANVNSNWCNNGGGSPDSTTTAEPVSPVDTSDHAVSATLTNLQGGTTYCAAVITTNNSGTTTGPQTQFVAGVPAAVATAMTTASPSSETITGTVVATSQATQYYAVYDDANSLWCENGGEPSSASGSTPQVALGAVDDSAHTVSVTITDLTPGEDYCAELVAANASGLGPSSQQSFTAGYPFTVHTTGTEALTDSSVTVDGTVNPAGLATTYWISYDLQDSDWCSSGGQSGLPGQSTDPVSLPATDTVDHGVSLSVGGLDPGTDYCAVMTAENAIGTTYGEQVSFTTTGSADDGSTGGSTDGGTTTSPSTGPTTTTTQSPGGPPARATVGAAASTASGTGATVSISCPAASTAACHVAVKLTVSEPVKHGTSEAHSVRTRTVVVGSSTTTISPGARRTVTVSLNAAGRALFRAHHRLRVRMSATENGRQLSARTVKLAVKKTPGKTFHY